MKHPLLASLSVLAVLTVSTLATPAFADQALATAKNCMACHAVGQKLVGPAYKDVAAKYAGDSTAADKLAQKIAKGSDPKNLKWGAVPMPANPQVNEADAKKLASWILTLK